MDDYRCLISVIVSVYNVEDYLRDCLQSLIDQTYTNIEILLIDDGSTDSSGDICNEFAQLDPRITVIHQENHGLWFVRNRGIVSTKIISYCYLTQLTGEVVIILSLSATMFK